MSHETIEELTFKRDGSHAYRYSDDDVRVSMASSWEYANAEPDGMEWSAEPDDLDEPDGSVTVSPGLFSELLRRAASHCEGCSGTCGR